MPRKTQDELYDEAKVERLTNDVRAS